MVERETERERERGGVARWLLFQFGSVASNGSCGLGGRVK